ncbi:helix-turn-helix domain-containing protein [Argonema antarcticum]|uniref:helix-turn-helix domain-containing protein n=1 Tax=Argonema antarcticum TaxID=2942763 RepID=UPI002012EA68|nr:helix-turn-helix transcriptional regulator [Argonema antarcticum]MCL1472031.1 helix-turn-helix domain-containing protein [Argonema antarcticum A004/B2]
MMIKNELEYQVSQEWLEKFEKSIAAIEKDEDSKKNDHERWKMNRETLQCHLEKLQAEIAEYDRLTSHDSHTPIVLTLDDIDDLPQLLIRARMAAKLSQKELADLAGLTEEQIKRYEDNDYEDASFLDVRFVIDALDIQIQKGEFLVPLDTLRRTPVTKEELLSSNQRSHSQQSQEMIGQVQ